MSEGPVELQEPIEELARDPKSFLHDLEFPPAGRIRIYDDTLRDGEQMPGVAIPPAAKYELAKMLSEIGVHIMDVGFPAVSEDERETLRMVLAGKRMGELREDLEILCMMRCTKGDIDATMRVLDELGIPRNGLSYFIFTSASDLHLKYKLGRTLLAREGIPASEWLDLPVSFYRDANLRMMVEAIRYAREQGAELIEFGGEDGSRADPDYVIRLHQAGLAAGATRPSTPDTVGCYSPYAVRAHVARIKAGTPDAPLVVHFHNDLGLGAWNTVVALGSGADVFTTSANGIGERTGNAPMHQVLLQLRYLFGIEIPGFKYEKLRELARFLERISGIPVQPTEPGIGLDVFAHESGIHTAGMLIHPAIYQFIPPADLGEEVRYVYGKHSGAVVVEHALREAGVEPEPELVGRVLEEVKRLREERALAADHAEFHDAYYAHLNGMGLTAAEVVELATALSRKAPDHPAKPPGS
ncbi:MAG: LeuA family protein [Candidatus Dormibacteraceae bacterium]